MPSHLSSGADDTEARLWDAPLVDGVPASTWIVVAGAGLVVGLAAAVTLAVLNFVAPHLAALWGGSPVAVVDGVCFAGGAVVAGFGFPAMFRQANREAAAGYTTLNWSAFRGLVPLVNPRTLRITGAAPRFDPVAARARTPWSSTERPRSDQQPLLPALRSSSGPAIGRWAALASPIFFGMAILVRAQIGPASGASTLIIGAVVFGVICVALFATFLVFRSLQLSLSKVSQVASGIIVGCFPAAQMLASSERLGVPRGLIPRLAVLVFNAEGVSIWRGSGVPRSVVSIGRHDVIALDTAMVTSGLVSTLGLEVTVIPPDERSPFIMRFTVFDPARPFFAANKAKLDTLITSITNAWIH